MRARTYRTRAAVLATSTCGLALAQQHDPKAHAHISRWRIQGCRELVALPPPMVDHMLANMRDHLVAIHEMQAALGSGNTAIAASVAEQRLGMTSLQSHAATRHEPVHAEGDAAGRNGDALAPPAAFALAAQGSRRSGDVKPALSAPRISPRNATRATPAIASDKSGPAIARAGANRQRRHAAEPRMNFRMARGEVISGLLDCDCSPAHSMASGLSCAAAGRPFERGQLVRREYQVLRGGVGFDVLELRRLGDRDHAGLPQHPGERDRRRHQAPRALAIATSVGLRSSTAPWPSGE